MNGEGCVSLVRRLLHDARRVHLVGAKVKVRDMGRVKGVLKICTLEWSVRVRVRVRVEG